jgi:hypothetical protein|eukprot:SAG25_NODE_302_length_10160_cov_3.981413_1_plen_72_part_00
MVLGLLPATALITTAMMTGVRRGSIMLNVSRVIESPLPGFRFLEGGAEGGMVLAWAVRTTTTAACRCGCLR